MIKTAKKPAATTETAQVAQTTLLCEVATSHSNGGHTYHELLDVGGFRAEVTIHTESYDMQQYARIQVWSKTDLAWHAVASIPHSLMKSRSTASRSFEYQNDRNELIARFRMVVL